MQSAMFKTIEVHGRLHVLKEMARKDTASYYDGKVIHKGYDQPDYRGTKMALCGILEKKQTLEAFVEKYYLKKKPSKKELEWNS